MPIPAKLHFCWIGRRLSWAYVFALLSAAERSGMRDIILHHTDELEDSPEIRALAAAPGITLRRIDPLACLALAAERLGAGDELAALYQSLTSPVLRSDVLRAAILYLEGGIYLDLDTITVAPLVPLLDSAQFVATEIIVWPQRVRKSRSPVLWGRVLALDVMRKAMRRLPDGWRMFRRVEKLYFRGVNNAVLGAMPEAPLLAEYLRAMTRLPAERQQQNYALGPELLQDVADGFPANALAVHPPHVFFPLPPEISEHWFRPARPELDAVLLPGTRVVHWYASVRTRRRVALITPEYVRENRHRELYSALVCNSIAPLPDFC